MTIIRPRYSLFDEALNLDTIGTALATLFPSFTRCCPCACLGLGFGSLVIETVGGIVFRIARNPEAAARHAADRAFRLIASREIARF